MTNTLFSFVLFFAFSQFTFAGIYSSGARYAAQGDASVANGNDAFMVAINQANLLTHSDTAFSEVAINAGMYQAEFEDKNSDNSTYFGGVYSTSNISAGFYYNTYFPIPTSNGTVNEYSSKNVTIDYFGIAFALGNVLEKDENLTYGIGISVDLASLIDKSNNNPIGGNGMTYSAKVAYQDDIALQTQKVAVYFAAGISSSKEILPENSSAQVSLKPQIQRVGISMDIAHLNDSFSWSFTISAEMLNTEATLPLIENTYTLGDAKLLGAEWSLIQPFGINGDISLRAGTAIYQAASTPLYSAGIGYTRNLWSFDIAVSEQDPQSPHYVVELAITKSFD
jgi:hypothetical protein